MRWRIQQSWRRWWHRPVDSGSVIERDVALATGLRYHLREWGSPDHSGATTILVHGFLDSSATWSAVVRAGLDDGRHLVAPDMRGHGDSDRVAPGSYYHFADYLADLDALIEHFPNRRLALVGHSMGGSICAYFAGTFPNAVTRLALLEGMGPPESSSAAPGRIEKWIAAWRKVRDSTAKTYASIEEAAARLRKHDPLLSEALSLELARDGTRSNADGARVFKHDPLHATPGPYPFRVADAMQLWSNIECPVLALEGSESIFRHQRNEAEERYSHLAKLTRATIEGAAHMMQRHAPDQIAKHLREFLDS